MENSRHAQSRALVGLSPTCYQLDKAMLLGELLFWSAVVNQRCQKATGITDDDNCADQQSVSRSQQKIVQKMANKKSPQTVDPSIFKWGKLPTDFSQHEDLKGLISKISSVRN